MSARGDDSASIEFTAVEQHRQVPAHIARGRGDVAVDCRDLKPRGRCKWFSRPPRFVLEHRLGADGHASSIVIGDRRNRVWHPHNVKDSLFHDVGTRSPRHGAHHDAEGHVSDIGVVEDRVGRGSGVARPQGIHLCQFIGP